MTRRARRIVESVGREHLFKASSRRLIKSTHVPFTSHPTGMVRSTLGGLESAAANSFDSAASLTNPKSS
jgi:hypothetical protein